MTEGLPDRRVEAARGCSISAGVGKECRRILNHATRRRATAYSRHRNRRNSCRPTSADRGASITGRTGARMQGARARCDPRGENALQGRRPQVAEDVEDPRGLSADGLDTPFRANSSREICRLVHECRSGRLASRAGDTNEPSTPRLCFGDTRSGD